MNEMLISVGVGLIFLVHYVSCSALVVDEAQKGELEASLAAGGSNRIRRALIVRSTTYTTSTYTTTLSTASVCYLKNYKCGSKRKRRNEQIIIEQFDNDNADVLKDVAPEFRDLVKRTADDVSINLNAMTHIKFWPSKVETESTDEREKRETEEREKREAEEEEEEEVVSVQKKDKEGRFFFSGVTVMQTSTTTTTSTLTSTIGTVGITGTVSACAGTSISTYFSKCG